MGRAGKELHFLPLGLWGNKVPRAQDLERGGFIRLHSQPLSLLPSSPCGTHTPAAASLPACLPTSPGSPEDQQQLSVFLDPYHHLSQAKRRADIVGHMWNETPNEPGGEACP